MNSNKNFLKSIDMEKITIYGAGRIGVTVMSNILFTDFSGNAEVIMYSPRNHKRVEGAYMDLSDAQALMEHNSGWNFVATNSTKDIKDSTVVFLCAGDSPTPEEYAEGAKNGIDDRMVQAKKNISILKQFCKDVRDYAPKALVFIVSNPVDMMTEMARIELPKHNVYGLGCYLDSARYRREIYKLLADNGWNGLYKDIQAWVLGHHCGTMFLHEKSFDCARFEGDLSELKAKALERTRNRGLEITLVNKSAATPQLNNGAYFAPALMVAQIIKAIVHKEELELPLNRTIDKEDNLDGLVGYQAQLMGLIKDGKVYPQRLEFSENDVRNLKYSIDTYEESKKLFFSLYNAV